MALDSLIPSGLAPGSPAEGVARPSVGQGPALASLLRHRLGAWGVAGLLLALGAGGLQWAWTVPRQQQAEALARTVAETTAARRQRLLAAPQQPLPGEAAAETVSGAAHRIWQALPLRPQRHADLQVLTGAVSEAGLVLERADLRQLGATGPLLQEEWQLRLHGPYPRQRQLLQALRERLPNAALHTLALDRENGRVEAGPAAPADTTAGDAVRLQLTLRLHYRSAEGVR